MITEFVVSTGERVKRLDAFLASHERKISRSRLQRLIQTGRIRVNAKKVKPSLKLKPGDWISMDTPEPGPMIVNDEVVPLEILFEDESLMVINKPAEVVVHPTSGHWNGTLLNSLLEHFREEGNIEPGLVHRLDKGTSGLMVVAKTDIAHQILCAQFEKHSIARTYEGLVYGSPPEHHGVIELAIGRDPSYGRTVSSNSMKPQLAVTAFRVLQQFGEVASHLELTPRTGRKHQLRVHLASIGCPIVGDEIYGRPDPSPLRELSVSRMFLHARTLGFRHPISSNWMEFLLEIPTEMGMAIKTLKVQAQEKSDVFSAQELA